MKEDLRSVFRQWCRDQKLIVSIEDEILLINELFDVVKLRLEEC